MYVGAAGGWMEVQRERDVEGDLDLDIDVDVDGGGMKMEMSNGLAPYPAGLGFLVVGLVGGCERDEEEYGWCRSSSAS